MIVLMWNEWKGSLTQCLANICGHNSLLFFWALDFIFLVARGWRRRPIKADGARDFVIDLNNDLVRWISILAMWSLILQYRYNVHEKTPTWEDTYMYTNVYTCSLSHVFLYIFLTLQRVNAGDLSVRSFQKTRSMLQCLAQGNIAGRWHFLVLQPQTLFAAAGLELAANHMSHSHPWST